MMGINVEIRKKLGDFSLDISLKSDKKRIGILGASGSGKSLTLKAIAGIETPDSGKIEIDGSVLFDSHNRIDLKPQKRNVGYMFQNYALFPTMTVLQNVCCGLKDRREQREQMAMEMISRMHLEGLENRLPGQLSGGQQQRVALARILVRHPKVILLDEPFSALDQYLRDRLQYEMLEMLDEYKGQVIMVSHNRDEVYQFSEDLFVVFDGSIIRSGDVKDVFDNPQLVDVAKMTGCKNISGAKVLDSHHIVATDWGTTLELDRTVPADVTSIGYRAHYFKPVWGEIQRNCIKCNIQSVDKLPFEDKYHIMTKDEVDNPNCMVNWYAQYEVAEQMRNKGYPDYLQLVEDKILLLK